MKPMEQCELHDLARVTTERLLSRVPDRYRAGFEAELDGGEYALAVEALVLTIVGDRVAISAAERDDLRRLLCYLRQPLTPLDDVILTPAPAQ